MGSTQVHNRSPQVCAKRIPVTKVMETAGHPDERVLRDVLCQVMVPDDEIRQCPGPFDVPAVEVLQRGSIADIQPCSFLP
jgi:hypothetical protein